MGAVVLGLTGGVCTGKSVVARFLREEGLTVIDADEIARSLLRRGQEAYRMVVEAFGEGILRDGGEVDRRKLGRLVFSDPSKRKRLEEILHPLIEEEIEDRLRRAQGDVVIDSPLLIERGDHRKVDYVIVVYAPRPLQIERMRRRDGLSREEAEQRLRAQWPLEEKIAQAHFIINNAGPLEYTREQALRVLRAIRRSNQ